MSEPSAPGLDAAVPARDRVEADAWCRRRLADALVAGAPGVAGTATGARGVLRPALTGLLLTVLAVAATAATAAARAAGTLL